jgi:hypothetical protein
MRRIHNDAFARHHKLAQAFFDNLKDQIALIGRIYPVRFQFVSHVIRANDHRAEPVNVRARPGGLARALNTHEDVNGRPS